MSSLEKVGIVVRVPLPRNRYLQRNVVVREGRYSCKSGFTKKYMRSICLHINVCKYVLCKGDRSVCYIKNVNDYNFFSVHENVVSKKKLKYF